MNNIKIIVWDIVGVLFSNSILQSDREYLLYLAEKYNLNVQDCEIANKNRKRSFIKTEDILLSEMEFLKTLDIQLSPEQSLKQRFEITNGLQLNHEIIDLMWKLDKSGYKQSYLTNGLHQYISILEQWRKIPKLLPGISSVMVGESKPNAGIYEAFEQKLSNHYSTNDQLLFIDDNQVNLEEPKNMGWTTYHYQSYEEFEKYVNANLI